MIFSEYVALPSRIAIVAASVAHAYGQGIDDVRVAGSRASAVLARTTAMAVCEEIFAPGSLKAIADWFGTTPDVILDARTITNARCEFSGEFNQTWRLLLASATSILVPSLNPETEAA